MFSSKILIHILFDLVLPTEEVDFKTEGSDRPWPRFRRCPRRRVPPDPRRNRLRRSQRSIRIRITPFV